MPLYRVNRGDKVQQAGAALPGRQHLEEGWKDCPPPGLKEGDKGYHVR